MSVIKKKIENHVEVAEPGRQLSDIERQESTLSTLSTQSTISDLERQQDEIEEQQEEIEKQQNELERQQNEFEKQQKEMERQKEEMEREHKEAMQKLNKEMEEMKKQMAVLNTSTKEVKDLEEDLREELEKTKEKKEEKIEAKRCMHATGHITMKRICTFDPMLHLGGNLVVVPSTGDVVIYGKTSEKEPLAFHIYRYDEEAERLTHRVVSDICEHDFYVRMLPLTIEGEEELCVACPGCKNIKLLNLKNGRVHVAFQDERFLPYRLCWGEKNRIFAHSYSDPYPIIELNTRDDDFTLAQTLENSGMWDCWGMCYAPEPVNAVILSNQHDDSIHAISYERDQLMWTLKGMVDGEKMDPRGLLFYPEHQVMLVSDGVNERVLVLNPKDGSHMSTLNPGRNMGTVVNMGMYSDTLVMMHYAHKKFKLSFFKIH